MLVASLLAPPVGGRPGSRGRGKVAGTPGSVFGALMLMPRKCRSKNPLSMHHVEETLLNVLEVCGMPRE